MTTVDDGVLLVLEIEQLLPEVEGFLPQEGRLRPDRPRVDQQHGGVCGGGPVEVTRTATLGRTMKATAILEVFFGACMLLVGVRQLVAAVHGGFASDGERDG